MRYILVLALLCFGIMAAAASSPIGMDQDIHDYDIQYSGSRATMENYYRLQAQLLALEAAVL